MPPAQWHRRRRKWPRSVMLSRSGRSGAAWLRLRCGRCVSHKTSHSRRTLSRPNPQVSNYARFWHPTRLRGHSVIMSAVLRMVSSVLPVVARVSRHVPGMLAAAGRPAMPRESGSRSCAAMAVIGSRIWYHPRWFARRIPDPGIEGRRLTLRPNSPSLRAPHWRKRSPAMLPQAAIVQRPADDDTDMTRQGSEEERQEN
jgi:hypothetical protein